MKKFYLLFALLIVIRLINAQSAPFYLKYKMDDRYQFQNSTIQFASQTGDNIVYLRTYNLRDTTGEKSIVIGYQNYLTLSDISGNIIKEILLENDSMTLFSFNGVRHQDHILLMGVAKKDSFNYLNTYTFDLDLNLVQSTSTYYEQELNKKVYFPLYNSFHDKIYVGLCDAVRGSGGVAFRFNKDGTLELEKIVQFLQSTMAGFTISNKEDKILLSTSDGFLPTVFYFDLDFNYLGSKKIYKNEEEINYRFHWFSNFLPKDDGYIGFGRAYSHRNDSFIVGKLIGILDSNLFLSNKFSIDKTIETGYTDGAPRFTGGIFKGKDGYYTCYDMIAGEETRASSTFLINKYDFEINPIWEKRFILDDSIKFWNYYAELTADDRFIISGEATDLSLGFLEEDYAFGHIIGLDPNGNSSTLKRNQFSNHTMFSVIENPVINEFRLEKLSNDGKKYDVSIFDMSGKNLFISKNWQDYFLDIDVSKYMTGSYFYTISEQGRIIYNGKFIKVN